MTSFLSAGSLQRDIHRKTAFGNGAGRYLSEAFALAEEQTSVLGLVKWAKDVEMRRLSLNFVDEALQAL